MSSTKSPASDDSTPKGSNLNISASGEGVTNNSPIIKTNGPTVAQIRQAFKAAASLTSSQSSTVTSPKNAASLTGSNQNLNSSMAVDGGRRRSSALAIEPQTGTNISSKNCEKCGKIVYPMESMHVEGRLIHKTCLKCNICKKTLTLATLNIVLGEYFCIVHQPKTKDLIFAGSGQNSSKGSLQSLNSMTTADNFNNSNLNNLEKKHAKTSSAASLDKIVKGIHPPLVKSQSNLSYDGLKPKSEPTSSNSESVSSINDSQKKLDLAAPVFNVIKTAEAPSPSSSPLAKSSFNETEIKPPSDPSSPIGSISEISKTVNDESQTIDLDQNYDSMVSLIFDESKNISTLSLDEKKQTPEDSLASAGKKQIDSIDGKSTVDDKVNNGENSSSLITKLIETSIDDDDDSTGDSLSTRKYSVVRNHKLESDVTLTALPKHGTEESPELPQSTFKSEDSYGYSSSAPQSPESRKMLNFEENFYKSVMDESVKDKKVGEEITSAAAGTWDEGTLVMDPIEKETYANNDTVDLSAISPLTPAPNLRGEIKFPTEKEMDSYEAPNPELLREIDSIRLLVMKLSSNLKNLLDVYTKSEPENLPRILPEIEMLCDDTTSTANVIHATISRNFHETDFLLSSIRDFQKLSRDINKEIRLQLEGAPIKKSLEMNIKRKTKQMQISAFTTFSGYKFTVRPKMVELVKGFRYETVSPLFFSNHMAKLEKDFKMEYLGTIDSVPVGLSDSVELYGERDEFKNLKLDNENIYYRKYFWGQEHYNYYAMSQKEPQEFWIISIKRELGTSNSDFNPDNVTDYNFRIIYRAKDKPDYTTTVSASLIMARKGKKSISRSLDSKSIWKDAIVIGYPELETFKIKKINDVMATDDIMTLDELEKQKGLKIGVMYVKPGQTLENEMFGNESGSETFEAFLMILGDKITLKDYKGPFLGGLDNKNNLTGLHALHTNFHNYDIMFHVSTYLPFFKDDSQQIQRKRHIGNDIVTIVFIDGEEDTAFDPTCIKSQFLHVFIIVKTFFYKNVTPVYRVSVISNENVPRFGPDLPDPPLFGSDKDLRTFILAKAINAEYASYKAPRLSKPLVKARNMLIDQVCEKYVGVKSPSLQNDDVPGLNSTVTSKTGSNGSVNLLGNGGQEEQGGTFFDKMKSSSMSSLLGIGRTQSMTIKSLSYSMSRSGGQINNTQHGTVKNSSKEMMQGIKEDKETGDQKSKPQQQRSQTIKKRPSLGGAIKGLGLNYTLKRTATNSGSVTSLPSSGALSLSNSKTLISGDSNRQNVFGTVRDHNLETSNKSKSSVGNLMDLFRSKSVKNALEK